MMFAVCEARGLEEEKRKEKVSDSSASLLPTASACLIPLSFKGVGKEP